MKKRIVYAGLILILLSAVMFWRISAQRTRPKETGSAIQAALPADPNKKIVTAPGRVEPISEEIRIHAEIIGKLKSVTVEEGDRVRRGQILAVLEDADYRARLASAEARLRQKEAELRRTVNGAREQERREAFAAIRESEATMGNAKTEMERRRSLHQTGDIAREEVERAERQFEVATARYEAARQRHSFVDAAAREEDVARAQAEIELARAQVAEARAMLDKTVIRAPLDGVILRKHLKTGETAISSQVGASQPIVTLADSSVLRVRVDVDEVDVARLQVGQAAYVTADAFGDRRFAGKVVRIGNVLGKKNVRTDDPAEKVDTKILETLIELDPGNTLPLGLRVNAYVSVAQSD
jgi:ABC exporter DevB family membrane fusion protein